jgi:hypothetical protein
MLSYHRKQEELKKLEEKDGDSCFNFPWADNTALETQMKLTVNEAFKTTCSPSFKENSYNKRIHHHPHKMLKILFSWFSFSLNL